MSTEQIVHPGQIEEELQKIWDSLQGTNKMRACLFNLVFYTKKNPRIDYLKEVTQKVIKRFPSRVIFITVDEESDSEELKTSVSVITAEEGECSIVCDLIDIKVSGKNKLRVPFIVLPQILPDLPLYLVYADDPCEGDPIAKHLEKFATRIIFDSETSHNLPKFAQSVLQNMKNTSAEIADLNWARIERWREMLVSTFYGKERLEFLERVSTVHIEYNSHSTNRLCQTRIPSIYLQGWLSRQLNWEYKGLSQGDHNLLFHYEKDGRKITVTLAPTDLEKEAPGRVVSMKMISPEEEQIRFSRSPKCFSHVAIEYSTRESCSIPSLFTFSADETGQSLVKEICHKGTSKHYLKLIEFLATIQETITCQ